MKDAGRNIMSANTETMSKLGPSGSSIRKNINLEMVKEIIRMINKATFFLVSVGC